MWCSHSFGYDIVVVCRCVRTEEAHAKESKNEIVIFVFGFSVYSYVLYNVWCYMSAWLHIYSLTNTVTSNIRDSTFAHACVACVQQHTNAQYRQALSINIHTLCARVKQYKCARSLSTFTQTQCTVEFVYSFCVSARCSTSTSTHTVVAVHHACSAVCLLFLFSSVLIYRSYRLVVRIGDSSCSYISEFSMLKIFSLRKNERPRAQFDFFFSRSFLFRSGKL